MEYSFSQTFGRGAGVLQASPTQSLHSSSKDGSKGRSIEGIDHSPVLKSYRMGETVGAYNDNSLTGRINELSKQARSYSHFSKSKQQIHRQAEIKLKTEIKNVEGLNQRMVNLIHSLKKDYNISPLPKEPDRCLNFTNKQNNPKIDRCLSACMIKKPATLSQYNQHQNENNQNNFNDRKYPAIQTRRQKLIEDSKLKLKYKIQDRLSSKNQSTKIKEKANEKSSIDKNAVLLNNNKGNYVDVKGKVAGSWGESNLKQYESKQKHKSAFFNPREIKNEGWLKSKVKTIESEMETTQQCHQWENHIEEFEEYSYVEERPFRKTKQVFNQESVLSDRRNCLDCGLRKEGIPKHRWNYQPYVEECSNSNEQGYQTLDFENKLKSISQKIENYQNKLKSAGIGNNKLFNSKNSSFLPIKNTLTLENPKSMPFKKTNKQDWQTQIFQKPKTLQIQQVRDQPDSHLHERKHTPTWGDLSSSSSTERNEVSHRFLFSQTTIEKPKNQVEQSGSKTVYLKTENKRKPTQNEISLKQRMSYKLGTTNSALRLCKQIELDEEFRKLKKELSKLPDEVPGMVNNKWQYIGEMMQARCQLISLNFDVRQIFELTDQEADPFFSIAIEDMQAYQQIVIGIVEAYKEAESYFQENILHQLPIHELNQIFIPLTTLDSRVKLDEFTVLVSNATKINHKCRDVYLLFHRLIRLSKEREKSELEGVWWISREGIISLLRECEDTVRRAKNPKYQAILD